MGTHPIFESDFDCLTEKVEIELCECVFYRIKDTNHDKVILVETTEKGGRGARRDVTEEDVGCAITHYKRYQRFDFTTNLQNRFRGSRWFAQFQADYLPRRGFLHRR